MVNLAPVAADSPAQVRTTPTLPIPQDPLWWLVLVLLPALAALAVIAIRGLALRLVPASSAAVPATQATS